MFVGVVDRARLAIFLVVLVLYQVHVHGGPVLILFIIPPVAGGERARTCLEGKQKASG